MLLFSHLFYQFWFRLISIFVWEHVKPVFNKGLHHNYLTQINLQRTIGAFHSTVSGLRSGLHRVFRHLKWDSNSKGTNMFSSKGTANGIGNKGTSIHHFTGSQWSPLQLIYRVQGVGSSEHCVGTLSNGTHLRFLKPKVGGACRRHLGSASPFVTTG